MDLLGATSWRERVTVTDPCGPNCDPIPLDEDCAILVHFNAVDGAFCVDVFPHARRERLHYLLDRMDNLWGMRVLDLDEADPEVTEDGAVRVWFAPKDWTMREVML